VPGCLQRGKLTLIAPALNATSQTLLLRAELPKSGSCLRPFQYTQAEIAPARAASGWQVPNTALTRHQGQNWLFVETAGGYRPTPVRVLDETEKTTLITGDLTADARIVIRGLATLKAVWLGLGAESQPH